MVLLASVFALMYTALAGAAATPKTIVSLGFDDGYSSQYAVRSTLASHGMHGTFFIISDLVGQTDYMTWSQIAGLAADGNEIAGHTLDHPDLTTVSTTEARRQICGNRSDLLSRGYQATDFAYPDGAFNAQVEQIVQECGYNSARSILWYGQGCPSPCTETIPPRDPYATTVVAFSADTLAQIEGEVLAAEATGGFAQIVFHQICDGCETGSMTPANFDAFVDWLATQVASGAIAVRTIHDVIGGSVQPLVAPPVLSGAPPARTKATSASISFTGEAGATFACSTDGGTYTTCSSPKTLTGLADGPHSLAVKQTDDVGNTSTASTASWTVDTFAAPPVLSGAPPARTNATSASISFTGEAAATFACSTDGGTYTTCSSPKTLNGLADGAHSLAVKQTDDVGNTSTASTASWTVDTAQSGEAGRTTSTPPTSTPQVLIRAASTLVGRNGAMLVALACRSSASARCQGSVTVQGLFVSGLAGRSGANLAVFGRVTYTVQPGKRLVLTLHLSKPALTLLARRHTLKVTLVLRGRHGRVTDQFILTLHAPKT